MPAIPAPDPRLTDGVIALRVWRMEDVPDVARECADPEIPRWTTIPSDHTEQDAHTFLSGSAARRTRGEALETAIVQAPGGALLGSVGLQKIDWSAGHAELGYWVGAGARRRGIASRAVVLLSGWAIAELGLTRIEIAVHVDNVASQGVARAAGYTRERVDHGREIANHGPVDVVVFALTAPAPRP